MSNPLLTQLHRNHTEALASLTRLADWFEKKWRAKIDAANAMESRVQADAFRAAADEWYRQAASIRNTVTRLSFLPKEGEKLKRLIEGETANV